MVAQKADRWDALLETPAQARARNLKARAAAQPPPPVFASPGHVCGLCDKPAIALISMKRFDKQGIVQACGSCVSDLIA